MGGYSERLKTTPIHEFLNKSASQKINKWLNVQQIDHSVLVDVGFSLKFPRDQQVDKWLNVEQIDRAVEVHVAKFSSTETSFSDAQ